MGGKHDHGHHNFGKAHIMSNGPVHQEYGTRRRASQAQIKYINDLFDSVGYSSSQRRDWLQTGYKVKYADELWMEEAGAVIKYLLDKIRTERAGRQKL